MGGIATKGRCAAARRPRAGLAIAPALIMLQNLVDLFTPANRRNEAQAWLSTSSTTGGVLMASKLIGPAERASVAERLRSLPQLTKALATLTIAARVLLEFVATVEDVGTEPSIDPATAWARIQTLIDRDKLSAAVAEFAPDVVDDAVSGQRQELLKRDATVRPFLSMLSAVVPAASTDADRPVLLAVQGLADLLGRKRLRRSDIIDAVVVGSWRRFVFTTDPAPPGAGFVDLRAYVLCVFDGLYRALRRRDVYALGSIRWGNPRANPLDGAAREQARPQVLTALRLTDPVTRTCRAWPAASTPPIWSWHNGSARPAIGIQLAGPVGTGSLGQDPVAPGPAGSDPRAGVAGGVTRDGGSDDAAGRPARGAAGSRRLNRLSGRVHPRWHEHQLRGIADAKPVDVDGGGARSPGLQSRFRPDRQARSPCVDPGRAVPCDAELRSRGDSRRS